MESDYQFIDKLFILFVKYYKNESLLFLINDFEKLVKLNIDLVY